MKRRILPNLVANCVLAFCAAVILFPLLMLLNTALKSPAEFLAAPTGLVPQIRFDNFARAWQEVNMGRYLVNSVIYTVCTVVLGCIITTLAAYPISREHFGASSALYLFFISGLFLPTSFIPTVFLMKKLALINTAWGYVILKTAGMIPLAILILTGFIRSVPRELDEASVVDGCGYFRYVFSILIPLIQPALATISILTAIGVWNDFLDPFLFLPKKDLRPVTTGLYMFFGQYATDWTTLTAAVLIITLPMIVLFGFMQRYIISGMVSGSLKG